MFFTAYVLYSLRILKAKTEEQTILTENASKRYKPGIKIIAYHGLLSKVNLIEL